MQLPQVTHVRAGMQRDLPRLVLDVDHTALSDAGLTTQSLAEQAVLPSPASLPVCCWKIHNNYRYVCVMPMGGVLMPSS